MASSKNVSKLPRILLVVALSFATWTATAQKRIPAAATIVTSPGIAGQQSYYSDPNEPPRAIEFKEGTVSSSQFIAKMNSYLNIPQDFTFTQTGANTDDLGMLHREFQQNYKGIPVENMIYRVHEKGGFLTAVNGRATRNVRLETHTSISEEHAFQIALNHLQSRDTVFRNAKKLIVSKGFTFTPGSFTVAFQFDIDVSLIERWRISIDARSGQVVNKVSLVQTCVKEETQPPPYSTGEGTTNYYGKQTIRVEKFGESSVMVGQTGNGVGIGTYDFRNVNVLSLLWFYEWHEVYDFYSGDNTFHNHYHKPGVSVQWAAEKAYDYYFNRHNRNSYDNNGGMIKSYVHVDQGMDNAFWLGAHNLMAFGDGSNNNPLVELDVVSHELTHGVTQYEARLQYYNEPGALNESFSDILGKAVEFDTFGDTATWQLARHFRYGGLRDLSNPNLKNQPDTYQGDLWYTDYGDNGGVHYNSGVQNYWFYLLSEGGSGVNDHGHSYSINPIGIDAAAKIAYRNLTEYLGPASDYLDSRVGSMLAAADLYGRNSKEWQAVDKAWDAVGVIDEPIITDISVYDITATTAKVRGSLLPRGDTVTYHFEYGTTENYGSSSETYDYKGQVEGIITGLQSQTKYYLRVVATNENGSNSLVAGTFTTISLAPLVKAGQTAELTEHSATIPGKINPNSLPTSFHFEYGLTPALGSLSSTYSLSDTTEFLDVSATLSDLESRRTYYYRLTASNSAASSSTPVYTFFTAVRPVISSFSPVVAEADQEVTIIGENFNPVADNNLINFGATRAAVISSTTSEIKVKVPKGGSFGPITLLDRESGLMTSSPAEFVPTFTGNGFGSNRLELRVGTNDHDFYRTVVKDMDGDSKPDIVGVHSGGFSVLQNVNQGGDISIQSFTRNTFNGNGTYSDVLYVADLDGNGLDDVVVRYAEGLRMYPNFSVPGFIFFGTPVDQLLNYAQEMIFRDFDLDGRIDIAATGYHPTDSSFFKVYRNMNLKGTLFPGNFKLEYEKVLPYYVYYVTTGDVNNDGRPDLLTAPFNRNFWSILKNDSESNHFDFEEIVLQDATGNRFDLYLTHDLNLDGRKDILSHSTFEMNALTIFENKGWADKLTLGKRIGLLDELPKSTVKPSDIDGDGKVDLMIGLTNREFVLVRNDGSNAEPLTDSTFSEPTLFGLPIVASGSGSVSVHMEINDLNGDGRPEIINAYGYNYGPHEGYQFEIWQNSPTNNCPDPSQIRVEVSRTSAKIILPPNTGLEDFEMEYSMLGSTTWWPVYSMNIALTEGYSYRLRARAVCFQGFTSYHYVSFAADCADLNSFYISSIREDRITVNATDLASLEIQYSPAGKNEWTLLNQNDNVITGLLPGTTYDLRFRGRCPVANDFRYEQFTTQCPSLTSLTIVEVAYDRAVLSWSNQNGRSAVVEYSPDNTSWTSVDESRTIYPLIPGTKYFLRGRLECNDSNSELSYTTFTTPCPEVSSLRVDSITPFSARVYWVDESNTGSYRFRYQADDGSGQTVETTETEFTLEGLRPGTQYRVTLAPRCTGDEISTAATFRTLCYGPFDLSATEVSQTSAMLSWKCEFDDMPFTLDYSISGSNAWTTTEVQGFHTSLAELRPGTRYEVRVHITCPNQSEPYASLFFETGLYADTRYAPNPTSNTLTVYPGKKLIGKNYILYDNAGRKVLDGKLDAYTIDLSSLYAGMYTLMIEGEKAAKIIKH